MKDDILIRYLDGEADADERAAVEALTPGSRGSLRLEELRARSESFAAVAGAVAVPTLPTLQSGPGDIEVGPDRGARLWPALRVASIALAVVVGSVAASPTLRTATIQRLGPLFGVTAAPAAEGEEYGRATVHITDLRDTGRFGVEVAGTQAGGHLVLEASEDVGVRVYSDEAQLTVLPNRVRADNATSQTGDLRLTLPAEIREVRVLIGERLDRTVRAEDLPVRIPLDGSGTR